MVDIHLHLWPADKSPAYMKDYFESKIASGQEITMTFEEILSSMDACGIDKAIISVLAFDSMMTNEDMIPLHRYAEKQMEKSGGRLAAFCTVNPFCEDTLIYLEKYLEAGAFSGLKLHPNIQKFYPDDERLDRIYKWLEEKKYPVLFHTGGIGLSGIEDAYGEVKRMDWVACAHPNLPIIMGHAGRIQYQSTAEILRKHKNVYADVSTNFGRLSGKEEVQLLKLLETVKLWSGNTDKLMLGSDYPFYSQETTVSLIKKLQSTCLQYSDTVEPSDIEHLLYVNADTFCSHYHIFKED